MASIPPEGVAQRPRYLVVALVAALVFAAGCWTTGWERLKIHRGDLDRGRAVHAAIHDAGDRAHAEELFQRFVDAAGAARGRDVPLATATFVLGAALLALAARGLAGRSNTRSALMQIVAAQAIVVAATYFATPTVRKAEIDWEIEVALMHQKDATPPEQYRTVAVPVARAIHRWYPPCWLAFRTAASILILVALSRPRSRDFFEAAARNATAER